MNERKGYRLYVGLGASQVRRRLRGFGHGVRKVESAGRGRAVIIHTATGRHLEELQAQFADVAQSFTDEELSPAVEALRNLGPASAAWLRAVGLRTVADLRRLGAAAAFRLVKGGHPQASLNLLYALAAGLENRDWRTLTAEEKAALRAELEQG